MPRTKPTLCVSLLCLFVTPFTAVVFSDGCVMAKGIASALNEHKDFLLENDIREYPSRKFKQGFNAEAMRP